MTKTIEQVVANTLANAQNYPRNVGVQVLGTDMSKPIDAVVAALKEAGYTDLPDDGRFNVGDRVQVVPGRWGKDGSGTVESIDPTGPYPIAVRMDGYPAHEGWATARFSPDELTKNF